MTALHRSLVDRAAAIRRETDPLWIDGEPEVEESIGPWFPARLRIEAATEGPGPLARRAVAATLLCAPEADLSGSDGVEVESQACGNSAWEIDGEPLTLLRGARVVGWRARLRRVGP